MKSLILHRHLFCALVGVLFSHSIKAQSNTPAPINYNVTGASVVVPVVSVSANEGVEAFRNLPQFPEALVPTSTPSDSDNAVFANAVNAFLSRGTPNDYSSLQDFLTANPVSPWRVAVLVNLGILQEKGGYFSKALGNLTTAWSEGQGLSSNVGVILADRAYAELLELQSHLGHVVETMNLIGQSSGRVWTGKTPRVIEMAQKVVADMKNSPQSPSFQCGPTSLGQVAAALHVSNAMDVILAGHHAVSDTNGYSLAQLGSMSQQYGLPLQMAYRSKGAAILTPAVIHLGVGHYSTLTQHDEKNGYLLQDTSFNQQIWMSSAAVDAESSGYFLVPVGPLPSGWRSVGVDEAATVWGSGNTPFKNPVRPNPITPQCCPCNGMPVATINLQEASALLKDTPVGYQPPVGPRIDFTFTIDEGNTSQPSMMNFCNMGSLASFNWLGYIEFNPSTPTASVTLYARGGGVEIYQGYNTNTMSYLIGQNTGVGLKHLSSTTFARIFPDGSQEIYAQDDGVVVGSGTTLKRAFLSQLIDPHGNTIALSYDSLRRIVGITDPIGQVTTLSYGNSGDPYKITQVTDPFGRSATFSYTSSGLLTSSTDALGLTTTFACNGSILMSMTTPYGTTSFSVGNNGGDNTWVQITDPLGGTERAESWPTGAPNATNSDPLGAPSGIGMSTINNYLQYRTTYYWGKHAMMVAPGDYTAAYAYQFNHSQDSLGNINYNSMGNSLETEKPPYESRIWYNYPGQANPIVEGTQPYPSAIARLVQNAQGQNISQVTLKSYNSQNNLTSLTDPAGRTTTYNYATNGLDLTNVVQGGSTLYAASYNGSHLPLSVTDASGQTTTYSYNGYGEPVKITDPLGNVTSLAYDGNGYLLSISGPLGATTSFTYDALGRIASVTDSEGYKVTYSYDNLDRVTSITYPDGTSKVISYNKLDVASIIDREGRSTHQWWDANRHMIVSQDPLGRITQYNWCKCGVLEGLTDANGNQTKFSYDPGVRLISKSYADGTSLSYAYDLSGRLSTTTDALNQIKTTRYNVDDTVASLSYSNAASTTPTVSYSWDTTYRRPTSVTDGSGTNSFSYVPCGAVGGGKVSSLTTPLAQISYNYDPLGRLTSRQIGSNAESLSYDALGRMTAETNPLGSFSYSYVDATARLASITMPGGLKSTYTYYGNTGSAGNEDQRLSSILNTIGSSTASQFRYSYDVVGNITGWSQTQPGAMSNGLAWGNQYDAADQLTAAAISDQVTAAMLTNNAFTYDMVGNRLSKQQNSSQSNALVAGSFNNLNQLTALSGGNGKLQVSGTVSKISKVTVLSGTNSYPATALWGTNFSASIAASLGTNTFTVVAQDANTNLVTNTYQIAVTALEGSRSFIYDANGNCLSDGQRSYQWDAENRLASVTVGTNVYAFGYDYAGRRVKESLNGTLIKQTLWDRAGNSPTPLEERNAANAVAKRFFAQGEQQNGTNYYYLRDHLGSVREMVTGSGQIVSEATYDPYGVATVSGTVTPTFQYAGYYAHQGSGLNLTWYRSYDPVIGRWQVRDPLPNVERLQGLNLYWYVGNNPNNWIDSNGQIPIAPILGGVLGGEIIDPIGGGIIGGYLAWQSWNLMINSQPDNYTPSNRDRNQDKCDKMGGEDNDPNKGKGPKRGTPDYDKWRREHEKRKKETGRGGADNPPEKSEWF